MPESGTPGRGVLGPLINGLTSGTFERRLAAAINSFVGSQTAASGVWCWPVWRWYLSSGFCSESVCVVSARIFLEGRTYEKVPFQRFLFLLRVKRWCRAAWILFVEWILRFLWTLTVVGGVIKHYSYFLVPYIVAENPDITAREAITLSRRMMDGHKWECFVLDLSFIGWYVLGIVTFGLTDVLFVTPYRNAVFCEYYVRLRELAVEAQVENVQILHDRYLYEQSEDAVLRRAYADVFAVLEQPRETFAELKGIAKFFAKYLGILLKYSPKERAYERGQAQQLQIMALKAAVEKKVYPGRLFPIAEEEKRKWIEIIYYLRHYSVCSLILLFFIFSFVGWDGK